MTLSVLIHVHALVQPLHLVGMDILQMLVLTYSEQRALHPSRNGLMTMYSFEFAESLLKLTMSNNGPGDMTSWQEVLKCPEDSYGMVAEYLKMELSNNLTKTATSLAVIYPAPPHDLLKILPLLTTWTTWTLSRQHLASHGKSSKISLFPHGWYSSASSGISTCSL